MATPLGGRTWGRRARREIGLPALGRSVVSVGLLITGGSVLLLQLGGLITQVPSIAERAGDSEGPRLPVWLDLAVVLGAVLAGT